MTGSLLALVKVSCKNVENNKGYFMKSGGAKSIMTAISTHPSDNVVLGEACFCVNTLCKFDDFRKEMSSAHENAKEFNLLGIVPALLKITDFSIESEHAKLGEKRRDEPCVWLLHDPLTLPSFSTQRSPP